MISSPGKNQKRVNSLGDWNVLGENIWQPGLFPDFLSEDVIERTDVGDESGRHEGITDHGSSLVFHRDNVDVPSLVLICQTVSESIGKTKLVKELLGLVLDLLFCGDGIGELLL